MMRKFITLTLGLCFFLTFAGNILALDDSEYPIMPPEAWIEWLKTSEMAPKAKISHEINMLLFRSQSLGYGSSLDLSGHIDYVPNQRNQGSCGNCWAWAGTGIMEIAHDVNDGVYDRLSVQLINSCRAPGNGCCGNNIGTLATWYQAQGFAIPWSNTNAAFADGSNCCRDMNGDPCPPATECADIATIPNYPINSISQTNIETHSGQTNAINNIKNVLNQQKGVVLGFALPDAASWNNFRSFWSCTGGETEATLWDDIDAFCGTTWDQNTSGGHAVVIFGYNDDAADSANHYWMALNSWGIAGGNRPNGFFRVPMYINYDCVYPDPVAGHGWWALSFETLDVEFGNAVPVCDAGGPYNVECEGVTTTFNLDGSGSIDLEGDALTYAWSTDCVGGIIDNPSSVAPDLTVSTSPGCAVTCTVFLTVTDAGGASDTDSAIVSIRDTIAPNLTCPADVTMECDELDWSPNITGYPSVFDACDPIVSLSFLDVLTPGGCPAENTIQRNWTAVDDCGNTASCTQTITMVDTTPPDLTCPADITIECDESTDPSNTGNATATDNCDSDPAITYSDVETPGACAAEKTITRTWTAVDDCGNVSSFDQTITVVDTTAPVISCNALSTITPSDAPVSFTASATDNCDPSPYVEITAYDCYFYTKKGQRISKLESCVVDAAGDTITIIDSGGIGCQITWTVVATDECGNTSQMDCILDVVKK